MSGLHTAPAKPPTSPQVWDARALAARSTWRRSLPDAVAEELRSFLRSQPTAVDLDSFELDRRTLPLLAAFGDELREQLERGDGVVVITGVREQGFDPAGERLLYLALGCAMGTPMTEYGRLYEVIDRGGSYQTSSIPVSMTGAPTGFHTDSSRADCIPDFVGLLCETPSPNGGDSLVSNALHAYRVLAEQAPELVKILEQPFIRDLVTPGVEKTEAALRGNRFPVFAPSARPEGLVFRYMRYWIERGQEKAGAPVSDAEKRAFDALDELLAAHSVQFKLEGGDILWVTNRTLAHNRTGYVDVPGVTRKLHRMWIRAS